MSASPMETPGTGPAAAAAADSASPVRAQESRPAGSKRLRLLEFCLVMAVSVFPLLLTTAFYLLTRPAEAGTFLNFKLARLLLDEAASLGVLAYVLYRQGRDFRDLGLGFGVQDLVGSVLLLLAGSFASYAAQAACHQLNFSPSADAILRTNMWLSLIRGSSLGVALVCLNPIFEEMIVRAYLMTEVKALTGSVVFATILSAALQAGYHLYQGGPTAVRLGALFLVFSIYYAKSRRLTPLILAHFYMDVLGIYR